MATTTRTRQRRDYGEGSVFYEESRSRWVGLLSQPKRDGKAQPRKKFTGKTRQEVLKKIREAKRDLDDGKRLGVARDTVGALLTDWQERGYPLTRAKSGNTQAGYEWAIGHLTGSDGIGGIRLRDLTPDDIETFLAEKITGEGGSRPLGHRSVVQVLRVLRTGLQWGKRAGRARENVADDVIVPEDGGRRPSQIIKPEEVTALLSAGADADTDAMKHSGSSGRATPLEAAWYVMALAGLRPGECFALRWEDIEWDEGTIMVAGSLVRDQKTNTLYVSATKTPKSQSRIEVSPELLDALHAHRKWQMSAGISTGYVFTNATGGLLDPSAVRRRFKKLCKAAGVSEERHPHELRHACGTILEYVHGLTSDQVADVLRHTDPSTYRRHYRHPDVRPAAVGAALLGSLAPVRRISEGL